MGLSRHYSAGSGQVTGKVEQLEQGRGKGWSSWSRAEPAAYTVKKT